MEMNEILKEMKKQYEVMAPGVGLVEEKVKKYEIEVVEATEKLNKAREELNAVKERLESIKLSIDALEMGGFVADNKYVNKKKEEVVAKQPLVKPVKQIDWKHKNAFVIVLNEFDNVIDRFRTQGLAAKKLGISQAMVGYWLKKPKEAQLKKLGYHLAWEY